MTALDFMSAWVSQGIHEEPDGSNRGPEIDAWCEAMGFAKGQPWCATSVSAAFRKAKLETPVSEIHGLETFPYSQSSQAIKRWFQQKGWWTRNPDELLRWRGALGGWTNADGAHGHIFMIGERYSHDGEVLRIGTREGNSNDAGSRNGNRMVKNRRGVPTDGKRELWFCDTSHIIGGSWWPPV